MQQLATKDIQEVESYLSKIPDILSSRILMDESGRIVEIHVLAIAGRGPKQVSRDVQSALIAKYNLRLDHKIISVAQVHDDQDRTPVEDERFSIGAISYALVDEQVEVRVMLKKRDQEFEASVNGINSKRNIYRLVVQATLECVHRIIGLDNVFLFDDLKRVEMGHQEAILVSVIYISRYLEESLLGSALLRKDDYEAIVKATLDAVNRKVIHLSAN